MGVSLEVFAIDPVTVTGKVSDDPGLGLVLADQIEVATLRIPSILRTLVRGMEIHVS